MTQSNESANTANIFTSDYANFDAEDVLHAHFTTILEQGLDRAFAEHGYLGGVQRVFHVVKSLFFLVF